MVVLNEFQSNCLRYTGGTYELLIPSLKVFIKEEIYHIDRPLKLRALNTKSHNKLIFIMYENRVNELYLYHSTCLTLSKVFNDNNKTKNLLLKVSRRYNSILCLEILSRVLFNPMLYYTLINYNLPSTEVVSMEVFKEVLDMFDASIETVVRDDMVHIIDSYSVRIRGYDTLVYLFKWINYLDLVTYSQKLYLDSIFS